VHLKQLQDELKAARDDALVELERTSGLTLGEAKAAVFERSQDLVRHELARSVRQMEEEARDGRDGGGHVRWSPTLSSVSPQATRPRPPSRSSSSRATT
jgi:hypothetical protein